MQYGECFESGYCAGAHIFEIKIQDAMRDIVKLCKSPFCME